jgi:predicted lipid carrier protein YhbT
MDEVAFPIIVARGMLGAMPRPVIERGAGVLLRKMRRHHPDLFRNLAELTPATLRIEPTDLPHVFMLSFGGGPVTLTLAQPEDPPAQTTIKGSLESLLALLEGRIDSDALFFTREIGITGDTSAVLGLRNTLDREDFSLLDEATSLLGPFQRLGRRVVMRWEGRAERLRDRLQGMHKSSAPAERPAADDAALRAEIETLKTRVAKLEARARRTEGPAA